MPSNKAADLYRFHDEAFAIANELKQLGEDVDASHIYGHTLMGRLSEKLRLKLIRNYGCDREKSVSAILNGLRLYASDRQTAKTSGIRFDSLFARVPIDRNPEESIDHLDDAGAKQTTARVPTEVANFYPLTHPAVAAQCTRDADSGTTAKPTCGRHVSQHRDHDKSKQTIGRVTSTTAATRRCASRFGCLPVVDSAGAELEDAPQYRAHQSRPSASRFGPLPVVDSTATEPVITPTYAAAQTTSTRPDLGPLPEKDCGVGHAASSAQNAARIAAPNATCAISARGRERAAQQTTVSKDSSDAVPHISQLPTEDDLRALIENLVNTVTELYAAAAPSANAALIAVARADPLDQEDNIFHVLPMAAEHRDNAPDPVIPPSPAICCAPAEAPPFARHVATAHRPSADAASGIRSPSGARPTTLEATITDRYLPIGRRITAEALLGQVASSQDDDIRVRQIIRDDSPLNTRPSAFATHLCFHSSAACSVRKSC
ncbi:hypothetical protein AAVH_23226 [Aphelenchoides avenae]|nr:hypothetical protein AAVH_23226 [Aphelenchus avenae]